MSKDFIPKKDADLLIWAQENSALITATPTAFGLTAPIATAYAAAVTAYDTALSAARAENHGKVDIITKDEKRRLLVANIRSWARLVQGTPTVTTAQRGQLGLNLRDKPGSPVHAPTLPPVVRVKQAIGRTMAVEILGAGTAGRAKPKGASSAVVLSYVGATAPADADAYSLQGIVTRANFDIQFPSSVPAGAKVWITAAWVSPRGEMSELSDPISAYVAGGVANNFALKGLGDEGDADLKQAA